MDVTGTIEMAQALGRHGALTRCTSITPRPSSSSSSPGADGAHAFYSIGTTAGEEKFAACAKARADPVRLHRRRQRLPRELPRLRQAHARRLSASRDHGRQRGHRRNDRSVDPGRRRYRQGRHRPGLGLHHAPDDRRRLSAALGDHRMRRRRARPGRTDLRRRRLHRARRHRQGLRRGRRFRHARRHARRPRRMRRRDPVTRSATARRCGGKRSTACRRGRRWRNIPAASPNTAPPRARRS